MINSLFYKFIKIEPESVRTLIKAELKELSLLGTILVAAEGINGNVIGSSEQVDKFKSFLISHFGFENIDFKDTPSEGNDFDKIRVRVAPQIIRTKVWDCNLENKAQYIEPAELKDNLGKVILFDCRKQSEYDEGHFEGALAPGVERFADFPQSVKSLENFKDSTIVTYCTGGIRCEKASAYLKENGFSKVYQLKGGILRYMKEVGDSGWTGACMVFDNRKRILPDGKVLGSG